MPLLLLIQLLPAPLPPPALPLKAAAARAASRSSPSTNRRGAIDPADLREGFAPTDASVRTCWCRQNFLSQWPSRTHCRHQRDASSSSPHKTSPSPPPPPPSPPLLLLLLLLMLPCVEINTCVDPNGTPATSHKCHRSWFKTCFTSFCTSRARPPKLWLLLLLPRRFPLLLPEEAGEKPEMECLRGGRK